MKKSSCLTICNLLIFLFLPCILIFPGISSGDMNVWRYFVSSTGPVCGYEGVLALELQPEDSYQRMKAILSKCDSGSFSQDGVSNLYKDGVLWKTGTYYAGTPGKTFILNPVADGIYGNHEYYITGGPAGNEYHTGTITATPEFLTSFKVVKDSLQWDSVGIWYSDSGSSPDGYGYFETYLPDGVGNWYFFAEKMDGYTINSGYSYNELTDSYRF